MTGPAPIQQGPCEVWTTPADILACGCDVGTAVDLESAAEQASMLLFKLTGDLFSGLCETTVRPCGSRVSCWVPRRESWTAAGCSCRRLSKIRLAGYPVREITEVLIDGEVLLPDEYRLDRNLELVRLADSLGRSQRWPGCQRMDIDEGPGTFFVSYRYGLDPPVGAAGAAAQLACAIAKACPEAGGTDGECDLPEGTVRVSRQGITIDTQALGLWLLGSLRTGMPLVDVFLSAYGRQRGSRRSALMVPEQDPWPLRV